MSIIFQKRYESYEQVQNGPQNLKAFFQMKCKVRQILSNL